MNAPESTTERCPTCGSDQQSTRVAQTIEAEQFLSRSGIRDIVLRHEGNPNEQRFSHVLRDFSDHQNSELTRRLKAAQSWRNMGIVEIAVENQSVRDYVEHWEGRTLKAESDLAYLRDQNAELTGGLQAMTELAQQYRNKMNALKADAASSEKWRRVEECSPRKETKDVCSNL